MDTQVVIAGAGPAGLMLAAELRLGGADVVVLEELAEPATESRASTLHARTMEVFEQRGLLGALGDPPHDGTGHFGGVPLDFSAAPTAFPGLWKVPQAKVEAVLAERFLALGGDLRRQHRVCGLRADGEQVRVEAATPTGTAWLTASYLVGCDGEDSAVSGLAGFGFSGTAATRQLLRADVAGIDIRDRRFDRLPNGLAIASTRAGVTRVMLHAAGRPPVPPGTQPSFADVAAGWQHVTGEDIAAGRPLWLNAFDDENAQADRYRTGRVLLAGDAAHRQMPVGGQALNLGLADAVNLGWKLAAEVTGRAPAALLDTYHEERHAAGSTVRRNIAAQSLLLLGGIEVGPFRSLLRELLDMPRVRDRLTGMVSGLDIRYGHSAEPAFGARCPDAAFRSAGGARLSPGLGGPLLRGQAVLVDLCAEGDHGQRLADAAQPWQDQVRTVSAQAAPCSPFSGYDALLVRPDGYVAWAAERSADPAPALAQWFGRPARYQHRQALN
jgi:oxygenase